MARSNSKPLRWRNVLGAVSFLVCVWTMSQWAGLPSGFSFVNQSFRSDESFLYKAKCGELVELHYFLGSIFMEWDPRGEFCIFPERSPRGFHFHPSMIAEFALAADISPGTAGTRWVGTEFDLLGLSFSMTDYGSGSWFSRYAISLRLPPWMIIVLSAILPVRLLRARFSSDRDDDTVRCKCGYDLRATPDRCPECGRSSTPSPANSWERLYSFSSFLGDFKG